MTTITNFSFCTNAFIVTIRYRGYSKLMSYLTNLGYFDAIPLAADGMSWAEETNQILAKLDTTGSFKGRSFQPIRKCHA